MAWYKTGTVSVTTGATSVTGVNTKFASNARVGDGFRAPDGEWYEIVNIASETVLGIFPAYVGATVSASTNWMVAPLQGYNKESADRLRAITDNLGSGFVKTVNTRSGDVVLTKADVGLGNVDNTSDANKPVSTAQQTAINGRQPLNTNLTAFSGLVGVADRLPYFTGAGALSLVVLTAKARALLARTDTAGMQAELGLVPVASTTDMTAGRLATPGWMGLGTVSGISLPGANANVEIPSGKYYTNTEWVGSPVAGVNSQNRGYLEVSGWGQTGYQLQQFFPLFYTTANTSMFRTNAGGTWNAWTSIAALNSNGSLPIESGGTSGKSIIGARFALGLVKAAKDSIDQSEILSVGHAGWNGGHGITLTTNVDCNTLVTSNLYCLNGTFSNSPPPFGGSPFYIRVSTHGSGYEHQEAFGITHAGHAERRRVAGVWQPWANIINEYNAQLDPQSLGGLMTRTVVNNLAVSKFANGMQVVNGTFLQATASLPANVFSSFDITVPVSTGPDTAFAQASLQATPTSTNDHFGVINAFMATSTTLRVIMRNGATAQTFVIRGTIVSHWK